MKRTHSLTVFKKRLREALIAKQPDFNKLAPFRGEAFKPGSGKAVATAIYATFGVRLTDATAQRWINGQGFPSDNNWPLLTALVGRSRDWLTGASDAFGNGVITLEAREAVHPYGKLSPKERLLELLRGATRIVDEEF
ncbi:MULTISPECIES: hypothetical protein [Caballeronia]|uniref:hypothetical protein n=1 Tax=Caballeronia TaxID=1827195 RepID=UPI0005EF78EA|nr:MULTISPECIES: hypothetical protein [unclassified Caballeronia]AQH00059.1 hypothetical protein A9R05_15495 [Burkholderia sp. KK1]MCE4543242.1 hypothetical protein [Caballeronia sp. PC1]MCE4567703.1 hypothetical protein [Caballeronia sp. CLC5]